MAAPSIHFQSWQKDADDGAAATATAELPFGRTERTVALRSCYYVPQSALTADASHYATISVYKRTSAGASQTLVASLATSTPTTGDWTALAPVALTVAAGGESIAAGSSLTVAIAKTGDGVVVPLGVLVLELAE